MNIHYINVVKKQSLSESLKAENNLPRYNKRDKQGREAD